MKFIYKLGLSTFFVLSITNIANADPKIAMLPTVCDKTEDLFNSIKEDGSRPYLTTRLVSDDGKSILTTVWMNEKQEITITSTAKSGEGSISCIVAMGAKDTQIFDKVIKE